VCEKSFEVRHFRVFAYPEEPKRVLPGPPRLLGMERVKETTPREAIGCIINGGQEAKKEILAYTEGSSRGQNGNPGQGGL
jgi:hypothetical protein